MQKVLINRLPEFLGADGKIYNSVYGTLISFHKGIMKIGNSNPVSFFVDKDMVMLEVPYMPAKTTARFNKDLLPPAIYNADA